MKTRSPAFVIGLIVSIILGFGVIAGIVVSLQSAVGLGYEPPVNRAIKTGSNTAELDLATFPDSHVCHADQGEPQIDWVTYCSGTNTGGTNIEVPPNKHGVSQAFCMYVIEPGGNRIELFGDAGYIITDPAWKPVIWDMKDVPGNGDTWIGTEFPVSWWTQGTPLSPVTSEEVVKS